MILEVVADLVEVVGQNRFRASKYLARLLSCWSNINRGRLKEFDSPQHVSNHDRERLQDVKLWLSR